MSFSVLQSPAERFDFYLNKGHDNKKKSNKYLIFNALQTIIYACRGFEHYAFSVVGKGKTITPRAPDE